MDADERRRLLREAFGDSSSDSETDSSSAAAAAAAAYCLQGSGDGSECRRWEAVSGIRGLWLCANFLSAKEQSLLLAAIQREGWFSDAHNQAMRFGDLPEWAVELSRLIQEAVCVGVIDAGAGMEMTMEDEDACPLPSNLLWREPLFDQLIANRYKPGEGICAHVDLLRFDDGIAIVSLESACVMHFSRATPDERNGDAPGQEDSETTRIPVYLCAGSLVLMSGEARYRWKHEINRKPRFQLWEGKEIEQLGRTSVTLRKLHAAPN